jgi:hypothetical protein
LHWKTQGNEVRKELTHSISKAITLAALESLVRQSESEEALFQLFLNVLDKYGQKKTLESLNIVLSYISQSQHLTITTSVKDSCLSDVIQEALQSNEDTIRLEAMKVR